LNVYVEIRYKNNIIHYFYEKNKNIHEELTDIKYKLSRNNLHLICHIFQIIELMKYLFGHYDFDQNIVFFELPNLKSFPLENDFLTAKEINSGVTFVNLKYQEHKKGCNILLFRKEEVLKVLIHELVHAHLGDIDFIEWKNQDKFSKIFCSSYDVFLNEAYTEWIACLLNIIYINIICGMQKKEIINMYLNECIYSIYICKKILFFYDIESFSQLIRKKNCRCKKLFPQKTNVISYYFLKTILLLMYHSFDFSKEMKNNKIKINNKTVDRIFEIIKKNISVIDNVKTNFNFKKESKSSLRLCLYEIKT
jgi:hypothetical protein